MTFFELYNLIINNKLKFSRLSMMMDKNEGFGVALKSQLSSFGLHFNCTHEEIISSHENVKYSNYITCWSKEKDSIAMWLLYSKNKDGIRIKTTRKKLKNYTDLFLNSNLWYKHYKSAPGALQTISPVCQLDDVTYTDFNDIYLKLHELHHAHQSRINELTDESIQELISIKNANKEISKISNDTFNEGNEILQNSLFLKDKAYSFESEVRACLPSMSVRNDLSYEEHKNQQKPYDIAYFSSTMNLDYKNSLPNIIHIPINNDFIEEICFDPRMEEYKKDIYLDILNIKKDNRLVNTNVFGSLTINNDFGMSMMYPKDKEV